MSLKNGADEVAKPDDPVDEGAEIVRLSKLKPIVYERERKAAAERLGIARLSTLDKLVANEQRGEDSGGQGRPLELPEPEPWPDPINGLDLLDDITQSIRQHIVMADEMAKSVALWVLGVHAFDAWVIYPRLVISSPERGCGKTTLLDIIGCLIPRRLLVANTSVSPLFRAIEMVRPSLLLDEADTFITDSEEMRGIVNAGHRKDGTVMRSVGEDFEPRLFSVWSPMAIAAIGRIPATIEDRSVIIRLRRRRPDEGVTPFRADRTETFDRLARMVARWAQDHLRGLVIADPVVPEAVYNRAADNWRPLLAVADVAGGKWPSIARKIAETIAAETVGDDGSIKMALLSDIRDVFAAKSSDGIDRLSSADLVNELVGLEGRPWAEWKHGKPMTMNALARLLKPFGIGPDDARVKGKVLKGYRAGQFEDTFARYLNISLPQTAIPLQPAEILGFQPHEQPLPGFDGSGLGKPANPQKSASCSGVAVQNPPFEEKWNSDV